MKRTAYCCKCCQTTEQFVAASGPDKFDSTCCKCGAVTDVSTNKPSPFGFISFRSDSRVFFTGNED